MSSDAIITTVITAVVGPIVVLYIANRIKNSKPKSEQIYTAFNMYEALAKRLDQENVDLRTENARLTVENNELRRNK